MKVEQISVFLENKAGRLAEVTRVLGEAGINIRALSLADTTDFGILRLIVDQYDRAREILKEKGFTVGKTEVVAVEVPDRPGGWVWCSRSWPGLASTWNTCTPLSSTAARTRSSSSASTTWTRPSSCSRKKVFIFIKARKYIGYKQTGRAKPFTRAY